jgi:TolB-like protein/class 3 adenylate cyclase/Flp pilus assembly protein TadD
MIVDLIGSTRGAKMWMIGSDAISIRIRKMSTEIKKEIQLEIAHVLFIDIVGYSRFSINEQRAAINELTQIVRATEQFQKADASDRLIKIATGDGMALVFYTSPEAPAQCAIEISGALKEHPRLQLRMGVHSGPVSGVIDVNGHANLAGSGLNIAQRVMYCGDAGHILLSKHVAEDLEEYEQWRPLLHDLGACEVKHGVRVEITNLYSEEVGNVQLPRKFQAVRKHRARLRWAEVAFALLVLGAIIAAFIFVSRRPARPALSVAEKSIAVLPFENLSSDKENAYFADGVQDEILTNLARIADLKVISRTSVMQYKTGVARNLREIGQALGVAHLLEGSVQRAGGKVRVNAQLIDARNDAHVWAQTYDRELADVFAIESELAQQIVSQLKSKLSPQEKAAIEQKPTADLVAHDLYIRAKTLIATSAFSTPLVESLSEAVRLLDQALERDPAFALAYYQLAQAHDQLYFGGIDHTPTRLALADSAIQFLARLRPYSGEAHLALAKHLYWGYLDYDHAREELKLAQQTLPNDPLVFEILGYIDRRQGRWAESTKNLERAIELDPQNVGFLKQVADSYVCLRQYADAERVLDRAIAVAPKDSNLRAYRASIELEWHANPQPLSSTIRAIIAEDSREGQNIAELWLQVALCERDFDDARRALAALPIGGCYDDRIPFPRASCEGVVAQMKGDKAAVHSAYTTAHSEAAKLIADQPDYAEALCVLGMADAALGNKEDAISEGRRAVELLPVSKNAIQGSSLIKYLALIYAWTGEKDLAFQQLAVAARTPGFLSYGELRLHPRWDALRGDLRFEKIVAALAPKDIK